jgi:hypothetical protein
MPFSIRVDFSGGKPAKGFEWSKPSFTARAKGEVRILRTSCLLLFLLFLEREDIQACLDFAVAQSDHALIKVS